MPRWLNARLAVGILLVLVSTVVGARVVGGADRTQPVWAARHRLPVGYQVTGADLAPVRVQLGTAGGRYLGAGAAPPVGYVVGREVGSGQLVPVDSLVAPGAGSGARRLVAVPVEPGHYPHDLVAGDLVDVYVTGKDAGAGLGDTVRVLAAVPVQQVPEGGGGVFAAGGGVAVELDIAAGDVPALVSAAARGQVDLVRLDPPRPAGPVGAAAPTGAPATAASS